MGMRRGEGGFVSSLRSQGEESSWDSAPSRSYYGNGYAPTIRCATTRLRSFEEPLLLPRLLLLTPDFQTMNDNHLFQCSSANVDVYSSEPIAKRGKETIYRSYFTVIRFYSLFVFFLRLLICRSGGSSSLHDLLYMLPLRRCLRGSFVYRTVKDNFNQVSSRKYDVLLFPPEIKI